MCVAWVVCSVGEEQSSQEITFSPGGKTHTESGMIPSMAISTISGRLTISADVVSLETYKVTTTFAKGLLPYLRSCTPLHKIEG